MMKLIFVFGIIFQAGICIAFGQNKIFFSRRLEVKPLSILEYSLYIRCSSATVKAWSFLRFYDVAQRQLLEYKTGPDSVVDFIKTGNYTEAPPFTAYALVTVEADSTGNGEVYAKEFHAELNIGITARKQIPAYDQEQYMRPFWNADTIFNETVLLYSANGSAACGDLLFSPDSILSVKSFDLQTTYSKTTDYTFSGKTITRMPGSKMFFRADSSFEKQNLAWFNLQSQWVVITYTHKDRWNGPMPVYKGQRMPHTLYKLKAKQTLRIVAYGMSITRGLDVSGYDSVLPYMLPYVELFAAKLKKIYGYSEIILENAALPGARADWAAQYAGSYINPLKPDLVILDFGMNDFWIYKPEQFKTYIETIIERVKSANPNAEFLLLSNLKFDPDYVLDSDRNKAFYVSNLEGYNQVLQQMETTGVVNLDMTTLSGIIYKRKKAKDCLTNPLHPNDYMARWYAQGMLALFKK